MVFFQNIPLFDRRNSAALDLVQPQQPPPVPNNHRAYNYFFQKAVPMIYAPFAISVMIPFFCFYTYFSVDPPNYPGFWFPLISDIGALDSQISFFSISICLIALLFLTTVFVRSAIVYRQLFIRQYKAENENLNLKYWFFLNNISLFLGFFATIGLIMVGVYPSSTCFTKHMIGVGICFPLIWVYIAFSTLIIYKLYKLNVESSPIWMVIFALISLFCLVVFAITFTLSACDATFEKFFDYEYRLYWTDDMPGFLMHRTSVFFEWFSLFSIVPFFLSIFHRSRVEIYKTYQLYLNVYV